MKRARASRKRLRSDSGEALVEMALVLPILLVLSLGMLDFGRAFHAKSLLDQAAREGARVAVVPPMDVAVAQARVQAVLVSGGITTAPTATVSALSPDNMITVTVTYNFQFVTPGIFRLFGAGFGNTIPMTGRSSMRAENGL